MLQNDDDALDQSLVAQKIAHHQFALDDAFNLDSRPLLRLPLSRMKRFSQGSYQSQHIKWMLQQRLEIHVDEKSFISDDLRVWSCQKHYLDFVLKTSDNIGLHAWLPNIMHSHNWIMHFDLCHPKRRFNAKRGALGFNRHQSMLWCGRDPHGNDLYLCFVHKDYLQSNQQDDDMHDTDTCLQTRHYNLVLCFLASLLSNNGNLAVGLMDTYPDQDNVHHAVFGL